MTPVEFQSFSGSTNSDWKDVIKIYNHQLQENLSLRKNRMNRTSKLTSMKNLVKNGIFDLHPPNCECNRGSFSQKIRVNFSNKILNKKKAVPNQILFFLSKKI